MYYSYVEIEYAATSFSPARTDLALKLLNSFESYDHFWSSLHLSIQRMTNVRFPQLLLMVFGMVVGLSPTLSSHSLTKATLCQDWPASCFACTPSPKPTASPSSFDPCSPSCPIPLHIISGRCWIRWSMQSFMATATLHSISMPWMIPACHLWRHARHLMPSNPWSPQASEFSTISTASMTTLASYLAQASSAWTVYALNVMPTGTSTSLANILASSSSMMVTFTCGLFCSSNLYHAVAGPMIWPTSYPTRPTHFAWMQQYLPSPPLAYLRLFMINAHKYAAATLRSRNLICLPYQLPMSNCSSTGLLVLDYPLTRIGCKLIAMTPSYPQFFVLLKIWEPSLSATWTKQILMQTIVKPCGCCIKLKTESWSTAGWLLDLSLMSIFSLFQLFFWNILFVAFHNNPIGGHLIVSCILHCICLQFYWPGMFSYIKKCACPARAVPLPTQPEANWRSFHIISPSKLHFWYYTSTGTKLARNQDSKAHPTILCCAGVCAHSLQWSQSWLPMLPLTLQQLWRSCCNLVSVIHVSLTKTVSLTVCVVKPLTYQWLIIMFSAAATTIQWLLSASTAT